jgi:polyferredoxin
MRLNFPDLPPDREVETAYRRLELQRNIGMAVLAVVAVVLILALGGPLALLLYPTSLVGLHLALRGRYERKKAERLAKGPQFSRAELRRAMKFVRWSIFAGLALVGTPLAATAVAVPRLLPGTLPLLAAITIIVALVLRDATRRYERMLSRERPESI